MSFVLVRSRASPTEKQPFLSLFVKRKGSYNKLWKGCLWKFKARFATQSPNTTRLNLWSSELLSGMGSPRRRGAGGAAGQQRGGGRSPPAHRRRWGFGGCRSPTACRAGWGLLRSCRIPSARRAGAESRDLQHPACAPSWKEVCGAAEVRLPAELGGSPRDRERSDNLQREKMWIFRESFLTCARKHHVPVQG